MSKAKLQKIKNASQKQYIITIPQKWTKGLDKTVVGLFYSKYNLFMCISNR